MKISIISDLHIEYVDDESHRVFKNFLNNPLVQNSDIIILLGDVFDFLVGETLEYQKKYKDILDDINGLTGKKVYYFTGNHDFKFSEKLYSDFVTIIDDKMIIEKNNKKILIAHGDNEEIDNTSYIRYKNFVRSENFLAFINKLPFSILQKIGNFASENSRKRGSKYFNPDINREKFRKSALLQFQDGFDVVIFGHSHIQDEYKFNNKKYLNCGFPKRDKKFIYIDNDDEKIISIE